MIQYNYNINTKDGKKRIEGELDLNKKGSLDYFLAKLMLKSNEDDNTISEFMWKHVIDVPKNKDTSWIEDVLENGNRIEYLGIHLFGISQHNHVLYSKNRNDLHGKWEGWKLTLFDGHVSEVLTLNTKSKPSQNTGITYKFAIVNNEIYEIGIFNDYTGMYSYNPFQCLSKEYVSRDEPKTLNNTEGVSIPNYKSYGEYCQEKGIKIDDTYAYIKSIKTYADKIELVSNSKNLKNGVYNATLEGCYLSINHEEVGFWKTRMNSAIRRSIEVGVVFGDFYDLTKLNENRTDEK